MNAAYSVSPAAGAVDSKGYLPVQITWSPSAKPEDNDKTLTLNIVGGNVHKAVKCSGEAAEAGAYARPLLSST